MGVFSLSRTNKLTVVCLGLANILGFMALSMMGPIYPIIAEEKGVNATIYGWVFGVFSLTQCLTAPLFGKIVARVGPKCLFIAGNLVASVSCILFGFMKLIDAPEGHIEVFVTMSFAVRIIQALGNTATGTAIFSIVTTYFPENPASIIGTMESLVGLGMMAGPAIAGGLYDIGGFMLPFSVVGGIHLLLGPISYFIIIPDPERSSKSDAGSTSMLSLLKVPGIAIVSLSLIGVAATTVILDPILAPHLQSQFGITPTVVGLVFLSGSITYTISGPLVGCISDSAPDNGVPIMILGYLISIAIFLLFGPSPLIGLQNFQALWLNIVIISLLGIASSLTIIPSYNQLLSLAWKNNFPDDLSTTGAMGGIWWFCYAFGEFIGPTLGGILYDHVGFAWSMTACAGLNLFMGMLLTGYWLSRSTSCSRGFCKESEEKNRIWTPPSPNKCDRSIQNLPTEN